MDDVFGTVAGTAFSAYLIAVVAKGNGKALVTEASKDWQYLEFVAAIYVLYLLHKSDFGGAIVDMFITTAIIALLIKMAAQSDTNFSDTLSKFAKGQVSMTETLTKILGLAGSAKDNLDGNNPQRNI